MRRLEALRDQVMFHTGTDEPWVTDPAEEVEAETGRPLVAMHWRKPLSIEEITQMAPTPEVRERKGRP